MTDLELKYVQSLKAEVDRLEKIMNSFERYGFEKENGDYKVQALKLTNPVFRLIRPFFRGIICEFQIDIRDVEVLDMIKIFEARYERLKQEYDNLKMPVSEKELEIFKHTPNIWEYRSSKFNY